MNIKEPAYIALDSTSLAGVAYDSQRLMLWLQFHNGAIYSYFDVQPGIYEELLAASSKGAYFHCSIRSKFSFNRLR